MSEILGGRAPSVPPQSRDRSGGLFIKHPLVSHQLVVAMADTRAQPAAQRGRVATRLQPQGNEPRAPHQRHSSPTNRPG
ncbi:hypothetical protein VUR80DRAFT_10280 [Thermomyces stellatus]